MNNNIPYIISYSEGRLSKSNMEKFESELLTNPELRHDYQLFNRINETMRAKADLEDARNDPALSETDPLVKLMISGYRENSEKSAEARKFIKDALAEKMIRKDLKDEIEEIKLEIEELDVNDISEGWVKEWIEKNKNQAVKDPRTEEIRNFIKQSLEPVKNDSGMKIVHTQKRKWSKPARLRVFGLLAASLLAAVFITRSLIPSTNPSELYSEFYKPMGIYSPITRGFNSLLSQKFASAIEMYNKGNYSLAASLFDEIIMQDASLTAPYFFRGISQMEIGNYSEAISGLSFVVSNNREYIKEARWYLGLSYLKTGEKPKAVACFETLSQTEGYYHDQAQELLRRLK